MAEFDFTRVGAVPMPRVEEFEKIMTAYGRDMIMGILVLIAGQCIFALGC